jgi:hypothetical protein
MLVVIKTFVLIKDFVNKIPFVSINEEDKRFQMKDFKNAPD